MPYSLNNEPFTIRTTMDEQIMKTPVKSNPRREGLHPAPVNSGSGSGSDVPNKWRDAKKLKKLRQGGRKAAHAKKAQSQQRKTKNSKQQRKGKKVSEQPPQPSPDMVGDLDTNNRLLERILWRRADVCVALYDRIQKFEQQNFDCSYWDSEWAQSALLQLQKMVASQRHSVVHTGQGTVVEWTQWCTDSFAGASTHKCTLSPFARTGCAACSFYARGPPADDDDPEDPQDREGAHVDEDDSKVYHFAGINMPRSVWYDDSHSRTEGVRQGFVVIESSRPKLKLRLVLVDNINRIPSAKRTPLKKTPKKKPKFKKNPKPRRFVTKVMRELESFQFTSRDVESVKGFNATLRNSYSGRVEVTENSRAAAAELEPILAQRFIQLSAKPFSVKGPHIHAKSLSAPSTLRKSLKSVPRTFQLFADRSKHLGGAGYCGQLFDAHMDACVTALSLSEKQALRGSWKTATDTSIFIESVFGSVSGSPDLAWKEFPVEVKSVDSFEAVSSTSMSSYLHQVAVYQLGCAQAKKLGHPSPALLVIIERTTGDFIVVEVAPSNALICRENWTQWTKPYSELHARIRSFRGMPPLKIERLLEMVTAIEEFCQHSRGDAGDAEAAAAVLKKEFASFQKQFRVSGFLLSTIAALAK